ncbi:hypothetical protein F4809DRAFT_655900 [Biscogniauxia mediterranea]|nr:hypothetical protein F4809DRAFT_655900 [Biscogniauxia mediterranea]
MPTSRVAFVSLLFAYRIFAAPIERSEADGNRRILPQHAKEIFSALKNEVKDGHPFTDLDIEFIDRVVRDKETLTQEQIDQIDAEITASGFNPEETAKEILEQLQAEGHIEKLKAQLDDAAIQTVDSQGHDIYNLGAGSSLLDIALNIGRMISDSIQAAKRHRCVIL